MKLYLNILLSLVAAICLNSCSYILDGISPKNKISTDKVGENDLSKLTNGVMYSMESWASSGWFDGDKKAEAFRNGPGGAALEDVLLMTPSTPDVLSRWQKQFTTLRQVNELLASANKSSVTAVSDNAKKTALFCRAYIYYNLVTRWNTAPILRSSTNEEVALSSAADIWAFIIEDLTAALDYTASNKGFFYVSDDAINALLAKSYLWMGEKTKAVEAANKVLASSSYSLSSTSEDMASIWINGTSSSEIVFAFANKRLDSQILLSTSVNDTDGSWNYSIPDELRTTGDNPLFGDSTISSDASSKKKGDIRKDVVLNDSDPNRILKFPNGSDVQNQFIKNEDPTQSPLVMIRISEMYLVKAEALGNTTEGHKVMKEFMEKRYAELSFPSSMTDKEWQDLLLDENFREFYAEGHRWFDVKRMGRTDVYKTLNNRTYLMNWPIPQREIDLLINKSYYPQNPGYTQTND